MSPFSPCRLLLLSALLAACADERIPTGTTPPPPPDGQALTALQCTVHVRGGEMRCTDPAPPTNASAVILGGQGVYVRLANTGTSYDSATGVFATSVTVENLIVQPLGTPDGIQAWGFQIFFSSGPTATAGSGTVQVANPDGVGTFTAADQPYFRYADIVQPRDTSTARRWEFRVDPGVEAFSFGVLVHGVIPGPRAVLRWVGNAPRMNRVASAGGLLFGVDDIDAETLRFFRSDDGGASWSMGVVKADTGTGCPGSVHIAHKWIRDFWAHDASVLYALDYWFAQCDIRSFRRGEGPIRSTNGGLTWSRVPAYQQISDSGLWPRGIASRTRDEVYVVAQNSEWSDTASSAILLSEDGFVTYTVRYAPGRLEDIWAGPEGVFAVGWMAVAPSGGGIVHSEDQGATWSVTVIPRMQFTRVWGTGNGHVWAAGIKSPVPGEYESVVVHSADAGRTWSETGPMYGKPAIGLWGSAPDNMYATTFDRLKGTYVVLHYNGVVWHPLDTPFSTSAAIAGTASDTVLLGGWDSPSYMGVR